jgi:hypothetical protein
VGESLFSCAEITVEWVCLVHPRQRLKSKACFATETRYNCYCFFFKAPILRVPAVGLEFAAHGSHD